MFFQIVHRQRPLQRQVVQLVVKPHRHIAARRGHGQLLMPLPRAMHDGERVGPKAVDHAIVDELARVVQHAGIDRTARHQLFHVARRGAFDDMGRRRPGDMDLLQPRHIHQPRLGADRQIFLFGVPGIGPGRAHAGPVFKVRPQRAVAVAQSRESPGIGHRNILPQFICWRNFGSKRDKKQYSSATYFLVSKQEADGKGAPKRPFTVRFWPAQTGSWKNQFDHSTTPAPSSQREVGQHPRLALAQLALFQTQIVIAPLSGTCRRPARSGDTRTPG